MSTSVGEAFPQELARCERLSEQYRDIGTSGAFGVAAVSETIRMAKAAWDSGDVVLIVKAFACLRACE